MFTIQKKLPLATSPPARYTGMAFDGARFLFTTARECKIYQYGRRLSQECCHDTCRVYSSICFDPKEHCFWASSETCGATLFKLNSCFQEIDRIPIVFPGRSQAPGRVTGFSYNHNEGTLVVAFATCLMSVNPNRQEENAVLLHVSGEWILSVLSVSGYLVCGCMTGSEQAIRIFSMDGRLLKEYALPCADQMEAAVALPAHNGSPCLAVLVSRRRCYPYLWNCFLQEETEESLALCPCDDSFCGEEPSGLPEGSCCEESSRYKEKHSDILDSLALLEKALSRILEAEGEKLQKILTTSMNADEMIEANRSVQDVIVQATHLEHVVYDILESMEEPALQEEGGEP